MNEEKIKKALKEGKLIEWDKVFANYSQERQARILRGVRYLKTAMVLR